MNDDEIETSEEHKKLFKLDLSITSCLYRPMENIPTDKTLIL
jgi:hypothetical protein